MCLMDNVDKKAPEQERVAQISLLNASRCYIILSLKR